MEPCEQLSQSYADTILLASLFHRFIWLIRVVILDMLQLPLCVIRRRLADCLTSYSNRLVMQGGTPYSIAYHCRKAKHAASCSLQHSNEPE